MKSRPNFVEWNPCVFGDLCTKSKGQSSTKVKQRSVAEKEWTRREREEEEEKDGKSIFKMKTFYSFSSIEMPQ